MWERLWGRVISARFRHPAKAPYAMEKTPSGTMKDFWVLSAGYAMSLVMSLLKSTPPRDVKQGFSASTPMDVRSLQKENADS